MILTYKLIWIRKHREQNGSSFKEAVNAYNIQWINKQAERHGSKIREIREALDSFE